MAFHQPFAMSAIAQVLLVLRPGPMDTTQFLERYGTGRWQHIVKTLQECQRLGYVSKIATGDAQNYRYTLTAEGQKSCPSRRQIRALEDLRMQRDAASDSELLEHAA